MVRGFIQQSIMGSVLAVVCLMSAPLVAADTNEDIDAKIAELLASKKRWEAKARYQGREADRIIFNDMTGYRKAVNRQHEFEAEAAEVDKQIEALQAKKK